MKKIRLALLLVIPLLTTSCFFATFDQGEYNRLTELQTQVYIQQQKCSKSDNLTNKDFEHLADDWYRAYSYMKYLSDEDSLNVLINANKIYYELVSTEDKISSVFCVEKLDNVIFILDNLREVSADKPRGGLF